MTYSLEELRAAHDARRAVPNIADARAARLLREVMRDAPLTDLGNSERLTAMHGRDLRHVEGLGWLVWSGSYWARDRDGEVMRRAKSTVRAMIDTAATIENDDARRAFLGWVRRSESRDRLVAMIDLAKSERSIATPLEALDADPWALGVRNGTIDLRSGELREANRADLITRVAPVDYDPDALAPTWDRFVHRVLPSAEVRGFVQRWSGYCLTGLVREQVLVFTYGKGANGKSVYTLALQGLLGPYGREAAPDLLLEKRGESHPTELADLRGARVVLATEVPGGRAFSEALIKRLTGGEVIKARYMRQDFFEFSPTHKIVISGNHKPAIKGTDYAIWRRIRLVPFAVTIPPEERDPDLTAKLEAERAGILRWALEGLRAYLAEGLGCPAEVAAATDAYRSESDAVGRFLEDDCTTTTDPRDVARITSGAGPLFDAFVAWSQAQGERTDLTQRAFGEALRERGFVSERVTSGPDKGRARWLGIGVRAGR